MRRKNWSSALHAICIGHSHSASVAAAARARAAPVEVLNFWELPGAVIREGDAVSLAPSVLERLHAPVFSLVGGAVHHDIGLLVHPVPFDFVEPASPDTPVTEGATLIPHNAVLANLRARTLPYLRIMECVRAAVRGPMFHMQSPPIFAGEAVEEDKPDWVAFHGAGRRIAPAAFRRKLWLMHSAIVAEHCAASDIVFVPCPPQALDEAGYLRHGLNARPAHANSQYGDLVLDQILRLSQK